jgi:magnesium-transporting ATPase (P-type)
MENPNNLIDSFTGVLDSGGIKSNILPANVSLRGCVLRSTDWMIGLAVNTGHDVKIMQTHSEKKNKVSSLEELAATQVPMVLLLLFAICVAGATAQSIFVDAKNISDAWYLEWDIDAGEAWIIKFFYMLLLHASFIPVSLYVSMAVVRFFQSRFMVADLDMYYEPIDCPMQVNCFSVFFLFLHFHATVLFLLVSSQPVVLNFVICHVFCFMVVLPKGAYDDFE